MGKFKEFKKKTILFLAWLQIFFQFFFPIAINYPASAIGALKQQEPESVFSVDRENSHQSEQVPLEIPFSNTLSSAANSAANGGTKNIANQAISTASGYTTNSIQNWLQQFGTAQVQLNIDNNGKLDGSSLDFLTPLYEDKKSILFTQLGVREQDNRITNNVGAGIRTFTRHWMYGGNAFFDNDLTGKNRRVGIGAEAWADFVKFSTNTYMTSSNWHQSRDFTEYNETAASGFDIRAEGYIPSYPHIGMRTMYEQYYGESVGLFGSDHLQKDPSAVTVGLNYTPIPLVTLNIDHKRGQGALKETKFKVDLRYSFGSTWSKQIDSTQVKNQRILSYSRYDLVNRNNNIVLQYKKKTQQSVFSLDLSVIVDNSPADGLTSNTAIVKAIDSSGNPIASTAINWHVTGKAKLKMPISSTDSNGIARIEFTNELAQTVILQAMSGEVTAEKNSQFNQPVVHDIKLDIIQDQSVADNQHNNIAKITITDINNKPIANAPVRWFVSLPAQIVTAQTLTDNNGQALAEFHSAQAATVMLTAESGNKLAQKKSIFVASTDTARINNLTITTDGSVANGSAMNIATTLVEDESGIPLSGIYVSFSSNSPTVVLTPAKQVTDSNGNALISFTNTRAENIMLTAVLDNGHQASATGTFVSHLDKAIINLKLLKDNEPANGIAQDSVEVWIKDDKGNALGDVPLSVTTDSATAILATQNVITGKDGKALVYFSDTVVETVILTIKLDNGLSAKIDSHFIADNNNATATLTAVTDNSVADGVARNQHKLQVLDGKGNAVSGMSVALSSSSTSAVLAESSVITAADGTAMVSVSNTVAETLLLTAALGNGQTVNGNSHFIADNNSATVTLTTVTDNSVADGVAQNQHKLQVLDGKGNAVSGMSVALSSSSTSAVLAESSVITAADGTAMVSVSNTVAETLLLTAALGNGQTVNGNSHFIADNNSTTVTLTTVTDNSVADGVAQNQHKLQVLDGKGNAVSGMSVALSSSSTSAVLAESSVITAADGTAMVSVSNTVAETLLLTAALGNGQTVNGNSHFIADNNSATVTLTTVTDNSVADGVKQNKIDVLVLDGKNNPVSGVNVTFTSSSTTAILVPVKGVTDITGKTSVSLSNTVDEKVTITATLDNGIAKGQIVTFIHNIYKVASYITLSDLAMPRGPVGDGAEYNTTQFLLQDSVGIPAPAGVKVAVSLAYKSAQTPNSGLTLITPATDVTDSNGQIKVSYAGISQGVVIITVTPENGVSFTAENTRLSIPSLNITVIKNGAKANSKDKNSLKYTITSPRGVPVKGLILKSVLVRYYTSAGSVPLEKKYGWVVSPSVTTDTSGSAIIEYLSSDILPTGAVHDWFIIPNWIEGSENQEFGSVYMGNIGVPITFVK
ncbi:Ig-like domain-containing protein [Yersinia proxima]|uniref:Ig-like domain-containing protein n=1 Tax=Yersinia proxima TaxID=2890316 RepID=UPI003D6860F9